MNALHTQLLHELDRFEVSVINPIETVFIGGGTPSTVDPKLYAPLFKTIAPFLAPDAEITSEANPNSATAHWLEGMFALGVNRISFGVQSFDDTKLQTLGRAHNTAHAIDAIRTAHAIGFTHLSCDLIYGVVGDTQKSLLSDVTIAFSLPIDHLSLYALTIEENTLFETKPHMSQERLELTQWLFDEITSRGFSQYEISNFGKTPSTHNMGYWQHKDYMGVGAGAVGFLKNIRFYPFTEVNRYIASPIESNKEHLDAKALVSEKLFLGLRSCVGVAENILTSAQIKTAQWLCEENLLTYESGKYFNPNFLLADEIALRIEGY